MLDWIQTLWGYNYWAHHKLWNSIMTISESDFKKPVAYSVGSVHIQVVHVMWAEAVWYARLHDASRPTFTIEDYPTRPSIREKWNDVEEKWRVYLDNLTESELERQIEVVRFNGEHYIHSVQEMLLHAVNHGTDHRGQILRLIHDYGGDTYAQDMISYFRDKQNTNS
jgi:uncharacterized damage-inducible protein DinB